MLSLVNVADPITARFFRLREPEYWLAEQLDGASSPESIARRFQAKFQLNIQKEDVAAFVEQLDKLFFLETNRSEQEISRASYQTRREESLFSRLLFIRLKAFDPTKLLNILVKLYRPFHSLFWFVLATLVIIAGIVLFAANQSQFSFSISAIFNFGSIVAIVISLFIIVILHEFSHAIICRYFGGEVREIGFLLMYFQPCFYSNLSDAWLFEKKSHRLAVTAAGPYFQMILFAFAVGVWRVTMIGSFVNNIAYLIILVTFITFLFNFNPLIKLDGYYLLSDWLDIPNLRSKAFAYIGNLFKRRFLGWPIEKLETTARERRIFFWYAFLALLYSGGLIGFILYLVGSFLIAQYGGAGFLLLTALLSFSLRKNIGSLISGTAQHLIYMKNIFKQPLRLLKYVTGLAIFVVAFFIIEFPHRVSGEVSIKPIVEFNLRLNEFGLLESKLHRGGDNPESKSSYLQMASTDMAVLELVPRVKDGQFVIPGDTLATLTSNQVSNDILGANSELERLEGLLALLRAPPKKEEVEEATAQVESAKTKVEQLQRNYNRVKELLSKKLETTAKLESAESSLEISKSELSNKKATLALLKSPPRPEEEVVILADISKQKARLQFLDEQLAAQVIIAPIEGIISAIPGNSNLMSLVDNRQVEILVPVSDFDIHLIELDMPVMLKVRSSPNKVFTGKVVHIPREATELDNRAFFMVSVVAENEDDLLYDGMTGYAKIEIGTRSLYNLALRKVSSFIRVEFWSWW
ncbi:MAG: hypothetical protein V3S17_06135 [candidate division Zixibacteria bacterium]